MAALQYVRLQLWGFVVPVLKPKNVFFEDVSITWGCYLAKLPFEVRGTYAWFHNGCFDSLFESSIRMSCRYGHATI
jgi:hypothetical protein